MRNITLFKNKIVIISYVLGNKSYKSVKKIFSLRQCKRLNTTLTSLFLGNSRKL